MTGSNTFERFRSALLTLLMAGVLALGTQAQAAPTVERDGNTATAIRNLVVNGVTYDVVFLTTVSGREVYGDPPPDYDFNSSEAAGDAVNAVNEALNAEGDIFGVGESAASDTPFFIVDFFYIDFPVPFFDFTVPLSFVWESARPDAADPWIRSVEGEDAVLFDDVGTRADFTEVAGTPNEPPVADPGGPYSGTVGSAVSFFSSSTDVDGEIVSYLWKFDDGETSTLENPTHTYRAAKTYTVTLTVTDDDGDVDTATTEATITGDPNEPPVADAGGPYEGTVGTAVSFDSSGSSDSDGSIIFYDWVFGDGVAITAENPTHTYENTGIYTVTLRVTDDSGVTRSDTTTATITDGSGAPLVERNPNLGGESATGIRNVVVNGVTYDVDFCNRPASLTYGDPPTFTFDNSDDAEAARNAVNAALNDAGGVFLVGTAACSTTTVSTFIFRVGYDIEGAGDLRTVNVWEGITEGDNSDVWVDLSADDDFPFIDDGTFADFIPADTADDDFNADQTSDILWRNTTDGSALAWQIEDLLKVGNNSVGGADPAVWQIRETGDFDGDGDADILFRNTSNGSTSIWVMEDYLKVGTASPGTEPLAFRIQQTGDFDDDGDDDILWFNTGAGETLIWEMEDLAKVGTSSPGGIDPTSWQIRGAGDHDGDGDADILWRNNASGQALIWEIEDLLRVSTAVIGSADPAVYDIRETGDFDQDGDDDVLWRNTTGGQALIWEIEDLAKISSVTIGGAALEWQIRGAGDHDGDGDGDILWRNTTSGSALVWEIENRAKASSVTIGGAALDWQIQ